VRRREFITLLGGTAAAWPTAVHAQQSRRLIRLAFFGPTLNTSPTIDQYEAFRTQLADLGFRDGQNLTIDYRSIDNPRGPFVAVVDLMRSPPDLIVSAGPEASLQAVVGATGFIPVAMIAINFDPLERGYISSLARPNGNITGLVFQQLELAQKQVELPTQAFPDRSRLAMFFDGQSADQFGSAERAAKALRLQAQAVPLDRGPYDFDAAFRNATSGGAQMVLVLSSPAFLRHLDRIVELANTHRLPIHVHRKALGQGGRAHGVWR
jgi:putative tryptophan/tyrosine transport system substrate-binding protein